MIFLSKIFKEFNAICKGKNNEIKYNQVLLDHDMLIPLNYTLEEVKKLNEVTNYSCKVGNVNGKNVAIIGIPNPNMNIDEFKLKSENYRVIHVFKQMAEEEMKDETFSVYPFTLSDNTKGKLEDVIQKIKNSRDISKTNLDTKISSFELNQVNNLEEFSSQKPKILKKMYSSNNRK